MNGAYYDIAGDLYRVRAALEEQKTSLLFDIDAAQDVQGLGVCEKTLRLLSPAWHAADYGYKVNEVRSRIVRRAKQLIAVEEECPDRNTPKIVGRLNTLIESI